MSGKNKLKPLTNAFYRRADVVLIARELLGKLLVTNFPGQRTVGRIVETEAYAGIHDKASHAYNNRRTNRTETMYAPGGVAYVYLCYGIHHLFNVVTNIEDEPHAVLIRGIDPVEGTELMMERMRKEKSDHSIGRGPGNVSKALGLNKVHTGMSLLEEEVFIGDDGFVLPAADIGVSRRIGVDYAAEDAMLPYRFFVKGSPYVSGKKGWI